MKFSPRGSALRIAIREATLPRHGNGVLGPSPVRALAASVSDEGIGIPPSELDSIFDKFIQSSRTQSGTGGTGLGLSISREIVALHGGAIYADNRPGGGAVFTFVIPREPAGAPVSSRSG